MDEQDDLSNLSYKTAWRTDDDVVRRDALELWQSMNVLPPGTEEDRLNSLCVVAYNGDELAAVSTVYIQYYASVRANVAWFRCLVNHGYRQHGVATELAFRCKVVIEEWSKANPFEKVMGFGTIVESPLLTNM
ncbi:hypothetical protein HJC23_001573 [Cyclotella cryptica]|uniref:N-acetyltransferase domain-containing protein n=1 Tax=Cyclotella cryptica TaxID=29204 RepID=A0ABD3PWR2_9STRA